MKIKLLTLVAVCALAGMVYAGETDGVQPLQAKGADFVDPSGNVVRFWGVNAVSLFPSHEEAEKIAENMASLNINLVRPHHMMRKSTDWVVTTKCYALSLYEKNSRDPNKEAWDRFDYLNAQLRKRGIYLAFSLHWSREFLPGDVEIDETDPADAKAWREGMTEFVGWNWKKKIDPMKILPTFDERAGLLQEEFTRNLLKHVNPYTGIAYGDDPQLLTIEIVNESSAEYCLICNNTFPAYFKDKLQKKWEAFAAGKGIEPGVMQKLNDKKALMVRCDFYRKLDEDYFLRMKKLVKDLGCKAAVTYSNLWRGENTLQMQEAHSEYIEDHAYVDPRMAQSAKDLVSQKSQTALLNKPYFIGELNMAEWGNDREKMKPYRTMLQLGASAYGNLQGWSGLVWFSWNHGDRALAADGWSDQEDRAAHLGDIVRDGMMLDHMRTCGMIFRRGLLKPSVQPITLVVDEPYRAEEYNGLMKSKYSYKPGWQSIHAVRKTFGAAPAEQATAEWMTQTPPSPLVSDTGEIVKDLDRKQLTVHAPQVEAFSGWLDKDAPAQLQHIRIKSTDGFATVVLVAEGKEPLTEATRLIVSRTHIDTDMKDIDGVAIELHGLKQPDAGKEWMIRLTRSRANAALLREFVGVDYIRVKRTAEGALLLPAAGWHECDLVIK
ncbi:MAG: hypothetical protein JXR97_01995 [Planctomycetes bacterium]|nr:hypothetical protein [Planctomycetota bacterium]